MNIKTRLLIAAIIGLIAMPALAPVLAQIPEPGGITFPTTPTSPVTIVNTVLQYFLWIVIIAAVFFIIKAGLTFVTANGDPDKINTARNDIMYAAIGVVIALMALGIVLWISNQVGAGGAATGGTDAYGNVLPPG